MAYRCAVIGNPIAHSKSPQIQAQLAKRFGIDLQYERILAAPETFATTVHTFFANGGRGLNITLPFKESAFQLATQHTAYAQAAGAVNTLWIQDGELWADNTDGRGLVRALNQTHKLRLKDAHILLLGAGGAARGILLPLLEAQVASIDLLNRTHSKAQALALEYDERVQAIETPKKAYDIILNATSAGIEDKDITLDPICLHSTSFCYDLMYGKETPFMRWAAQHGCQHIADGYTMLENQAWYAFHIWFGALISKDKTTI